MKEVEKQISQWTLCTPLGFSETSMCLRVAKTHSYEFYASF